MKKVLKNEGRVLELLCFGMPDCNGKCCLALSEQEKFQFCSLTKMNPLNKSIFERYLKVRFAGFHLCNNNR